MVGILYSIYMKREFEICLFDNKEFVDLSLLYVVDKYTMTALNMMMIFYPFRIFAFISRFNFSIAINGMLNAIVRMSPGLFTYGAIVIIIALCISVSTMNLIGPIIPEMSSFTGALFMTMTVNFFEHEKFSKLIE